MNDSLSRQPGKLALSSVRMLYFVNTRWERLHGTDWHGEPPGKGHILESAVMVQAGDRCSTHHWWPTHHYFVLSSFCPTELGVWSMIPLHSAKY